MSDTAASVLARLKNKARETGRSNQLCLQLFCQEEFLRRIQLSRYADMMVLKGGLFVYALTEFEGRATVDVDFLLKSIPNTPESLQRVLSEILDIDTGNDYISFKVTKIEPIALTKEYSGIGATIVASIKNTRTVFTVDFGVGDVIVPKEEKRTIPSQLGDFESPVISAYSLESTIAEKLDAILSLLEFSSRMKDYYDILYLSRMFDFEGVVLVEAIAATFNNRKRDFGFEVYQRFLELKDNPEIQRRWSAFLQKLGVAEVGFEEALTEIDRFLSEPMSKLISREAFSKSWQTQDQAWHE